jgi:hypothetical protein
LKEKKNISILEMKSTLYVAVTYGMNSGSIINQTWKEEVTPGNYSVCYADIIQIHEVTCSDLIRKKACGNLYVISE